MLFIMRYLNPSDIPSTGGTETVSFTGNTSVWRIVPRILQEIRILMGFLVARLFHSVLPGVSIMTSRVGYKCWNGF